MPVVHCITVVLLLLLMLMLVLVLPPMPMLTLTPLHPKATARPTLHHQFNSIMSNLSGTKDRLKLADDPVAYGKTWTASKHSAAHCTPTRPRAVHFHVLRLLRGIDSRTVTATARHKPALAHRVLES